MLVNSNMEKLNKKTLFVLIYSLTFSKHCFGCFSLFFDSWQWRCREWERERCDIQQRSPVSFKWGILHCYCPLPVCFYLINYCGWSTISLPLMHLHVSLINTCNLTIGTHVWVCESDWHVIMLWGKSQWLESFYGQDHSWSGIKDRSAEMHDC